MFHSSSHYPKELPLTASIVTGVPHPNSYDDDGNVSCRRCVALLSHSHVEVSIISWVRKVRDTALSLKV
jgi:hypothetical protein